MNSLQLRSYAKTFIMNSQEEVVDMNEIRDASERIDEDSCTSCSCSFCERSKLKSEGKQMIITRRVYTTNSAQIIREGRDDNEYEYRYGEKIKISTMNEGELRKNTNDNLGKKMKDCFFDRNNLLRNHGSCFSSFQQLLRPLTCQQKTTYDKVMKDDSTQSIDSRVPSIILLEEKQKIRSDRKREILLQHTKQDTLRKAENLKAMLENDLRTRTATATTASETFSHQFEIQQHDFAPTISHDSTIKSEDDYDEKHDVSITSTVSSISIPSFSDMMIYSLEKIDLSLSEDDPLNLLVVDWDQGDATENNDRHDMKGTNRKFNLSGSICRSCRDEASNDILIVRTRSGMSILSSFESGDENYNKQEINTYNDSFVSFDDVISNTALDITDGISYDDDIVDALSIAKMKSKNNNSEDDKAELDYLCDDSVQSLSVKSYERDDVI